MRIKAGPLAAVVLAVAAVGIVVGGLDLGEDPPGASPPWRSAVPTSGESPALDWPTPSAAQIAADLARAGIVAARPRVGGYDRSCSPGHGCVFGPSWSDDTSAPGGHNGCGTRDDVLTAQLRDVGFRPGSRCVVVSGELADPFTGALIPFSKADAGQVQVDHIYPLAAAWDIGAWAWSSDTRAVFANDLETELLAVSGPANQEKGDRTPGEWLPPNAGFRCQYVTLFLRVALRYRLPITVRDQDAIRGVAAGC